MDPLDVTFCFLEGNLNTCFGALVLPDANWVRVCTVTREEKKIWLAASRAVLLLCWPSSVEFLETGLPGFESKTLGRQKLIQPGGLYVNFAERLIGAGECDTAGQCWPFTLCRSDYMPRWPLTPGAWAWPRIDLPIFASYECSKSRTHVALRRASCRWRFVRRLHTATSCLSH